MNKAEFNMILNKMIEMTDEQIKELMEQCEIELEAREELAEEAN